MAIPFLNNIDLRNNEIQNVRLQNAGTVNAANGQIFFNTGVNLAQYYANAIDTWVSLKEYSFGNGTYINNTVTGTAAKPIITADLSAVDGTAAASERYLTKNNKWAEISTIPGTYSWNIQGDTGGTTAVASGGTIDIAGGTNVATALSGNTLTINATNDNDYLTGLSFDANDGILTATVQNQSNVTVDLDGRYLTGNETITLSGDVTGSGTTSIATTISAGAVDFAMLNPAIVITEAEGIENNDNDVTIPTSAAVKAYADSLIVGGLIYQGGYNAATNTPNLETPSPNLIKKGWTYTVTSDGLFFTEQVRVGDVLIAESDAPTTLASWTTVQNNIDLASLTQVGIGNVNAGTGISVAYTNGTATVTNNDRNSQNTTTGTITAGNLAGTAWHTFGVNTIVQTISSTGDTVFCDVTRTSTSVTATVSAVQATDITILVQKIG